MNPPDFPRPLVSALLALFVVTAAIAAADAARADAGASSAAVMPAKSDPRVAVERVRSLARASLDESFLAALGDDLPGLPPSLAFVQNEFGRPREIVKNAPYSADAVTEVVQVLSDGNRIVRKSSVLLARDSAGRTRQERKGDGRAGIFIFDPIAGTSVMLDEGTRTAVPLPRVPAPPEPPAPPMAGVSGLPPSPPAPPAPPMSDRGTREVEVQPGRVIVKRRTTDPSGREDVHVEVIRIAGGEAGATPPGTPMPPMPPLTFPLVPRDKGETKSLGAREFDGVKADGTLTTYTIPAGTVGNEKAIVITSERWFSPELHVVVFARTTDPRAGETTYRLANVKRTEPSADLFKVPADYRTRGTRRS
jgi:hypothetical protein